MGVLSGYKSHLLSVVILRKQSDRRISKIVMPETNHKRKKIMDKYKEMYLILFNAITDVIKKLEDVQKKVEEIYMDKE